MKRQSLAQQPGEVFPGQRGLLAQGGGIEAVGAHRGDGRGQGVGRQAEPRLPDAVRTLGITAGASAPELLVRELVNRLSERYAITEQEIETTRETVAFKLPRGLDAAA